MTTIHLISVSVLEEDKSLQELDYNCQKFLQKMSEDISLIGKISKLHSQKPLDFLFVEDFSRYRGVLRYCQRNNIISEQTDSISTTDKFLYVYERIRDSKNIVHIIKVFEQEQLSQLYQRAGFEIFY